MKCKEVFTGAFFTLLSAKGSSLFSSMFPTNEHLTALAFNMKYGSFTISKELEEGMQGLSVDDLSEMFYGIFGGSWERIAETLTAVYNPVENYSKTLTEATERGKGDETETTTPSGGTVVKNQQNGTITTTSETETAPYNEETYHNREKNTVTSVPSSGFYTTQETSALQGSKTERNLTHDNVTKNTETFGSISGDEIELHRIIETGNIGVQTGAEMAQAEIDLRSKNTFLLIVFSDIVSYSIRGVEE